MPKSGGVGGLLSSAVNPDTGQLNLLSIFSPEQLKSNDMRRKLLETQAKADQEDQQMRGVLSALGLGEKVQGESRATQEAVGEFLGDRGGRRKAEEIKAAGGGGLQGALDAGKAALREQQIAGVSTEQIEARQEEQALVASSAPPGVNPQTFAATNPSGQQEILTAAGAAQVRAHSAQETEAAKAREWRKLRRLDLAGSFFRELAVVGAREKATFETPGSINADGTLTQSVVQTSPGGTAAVAARLGIPQWKLNRGIARVLAGRRWGKGGKGGKRGNRVSIKPRDLRVRGAIQKTSEAMQDDGVGLGPATMYAMYTEMGPERMLALPHAQEFTDGSNDQMAQAIVDRLGIPAELIKSGLIQDIPKGELNALIEMMMAQLGVGGDDDRHALRSVVIQKLQQARL